MINALGPRIVHLRDSLAAEYGSNVADTEHQARTCTFERNSRIMASNRSCRDLWLARSLLNSALGGTLEGSKRMNRKTPGTMEEYLRSTKYCDSSDETIRVKVRNIAGSSCIPQEVAVKIFEYVRDTILFDAALDIRLPPSETMKRKIVDYCNKVNLHVALLRAAGIPARYHIVQVRKEALRYFVPRFMYHFLPSPVGHFWCECYLSDRWIACEALFDKRFYQGLLRLGYVTHEQVPTIEWDGKSNLILLEEWYAEEKKIAADYADLIRLSQQSGMPPYPICKLFDRGAAFLSRRRTDRIREQ